MVPIPQDDPLAAVLREYSATSQKGGDPANPGAPSPGFTIPVNGKPLQFASPEDAGQVFASTIQDYERQLQEFKAERESLAAQLNTLNRTPPPNPAMDMGAPKSVVDPEEHARALLQDPVKAYAMVRDHDPEFKKLKERLDKQENSQVATTFLNAHPVYANQRDTQIIEGLRNQMGLPFTPQSLEAVAALAQQRGLLQNEQAIIAGQRAQQFQQFSQQMQNPTEPTYGGPQNVAPGPGYQYPMSPAMQYGQSVAPPPSPGRFGSAPGGVSQDQLTDMSANMTTDQLRAAIQRLSQGQR